MSQIDQSVFKPYDIRGTYPDQIDERFAYRLGRALPAVLQVPIEEKTLMGQPAKFRGRVRRVVVGHDSRLSSPALYAALAAGLADAGAEVGGLGLCATELVYYASGSGLGFDLGVMITASHNPPEYNGFKVVMATGEPVTGTGGLATAREMMEGMTEEAPAEPPPPSKTVAVERDYMEFALGLVGAPLPARLRVAVDAGNGVAGLLWQPLAPRLGLNLTCINCEPDGRFPAHHPDPTRRENLEPLIAAVREQGLDVGFSYDGDADRVVAVLDDGHVVDGSEVIVCIVTRLLKQDPALVFGVGQTVSRKALQHFEQIGVEPVMVPVGHAKIKRRLRAEGGMAFAGEDAGHYYYRDFFCCDSSLITTLHILRLASEGRLKGLIGSLDAAWVRPAMEPSFRFDDPAEAMAVCRRVALAQIDRQRATPVEITCERRGRIERRCAPADIEGCDGVRVDYEDWWFCVRPSGTEPIARLALEARGRPLLEASEEALRRLFEAFRSGA